MTITNNYKMNGWDGGKYFVLTTLSPFGGQNYTLPVFLMLLGVMSVLSAVHIMRQVVRLRILSRDNAMGVANRLSGD